MKHISRKLKNGAKVILVKDSNAKTSIISAFIKSGPLYELKKNNGLSHFVEHMLFRGTKSYPNSKLLFDALDEHNIDFFAETKKDSTYIEFSSPLYEIEKSLEIFSEVLSSPIFREEDIKIEKKVVIEEIKNSRLEPEKEFLEKTNKILFKNTALALSTKGTIKNIQKLSRKEIHHFWEKHYSVKNLTICFSGNNDLSFVEKLLEKNLKLPKGKLVKEPLLKIGPNKFIKKTSKNSKLKNRTFFSWIFISPSAISDEFYHTFLLNTIVNKRLDYLIREKLGLSYNIESAWTQFKQLGVLDINLWLESKNLEKVKKFIFEEINNLEASQGELLTAKKKISNYFKLTMNNVAETIYYLGEQSIIRAGQPLISAKEAMKRVNDLEIKEFNDFAKRILNEKKSILFVEKAK